MIKNAAYRDYIHLNDLKVEASTIINN